MRGSAIKMFLTIFGLSMLTCASPKPPKPTSEYQENKKEFVSKLEKTTVALIRLSPSGDLAPYCSGVWISKDKILTAQHCMEIDEDAGAPKGVVLFQDFQDQNKMIRVAVMTASDDNNDLALLTTSMPPEKHPIAELSETGAWDGQHVCIVGHTVGLWWSYIEGNISSSRDNVGNFSKLLQVSSPVWFGNSGGGAFDEDGKLIGISSWIFTKAPMITFFVHVDVIKEFLQKNSQP